MIITNIRNAREYTENLLKIKTKENKIVPFILNEPQDKLYHIIKRENDAGRPIRLIILKARQMGFSTLSEALIFHRTATKENVNSMIIAHKEDATTNLFNMSKLFYENLPPILQPMRKASNSKELIFENPTRDLMEKVKNAGLRSKIKCATAGGEGVGRSDTLSNLHASEFAFWTGDKKSTLNGLMQSVPPLAGTMVVIESTANGFDEFKNMWDRAVAGKSDFIPVFFAWYELKDYRREYNGFELTAEEQQIKDAYKLDNNQIAWRRWCIENNCGGDIDLFKQEYPATPDEAFLSTGKCLFDKEKVILQQQRIKDKPYKRGYFDYDYDGLRLSNIQWIDDKKGAIKLYKEPIKGVPYVLGGDTAGDGSDNFVGQMLDNTTGEQVATLKHTYDEDIYAKQMYCLGYFYNWALIGIECNYSSYPIKELQRLEYPNQYFRETMDEITNKMKYKYGFRTDRTTRPVIIAELVKIVRETPHLFNDADTLREFLYFVKNEQGRAEAQSGEHDDCVMAVAIAHAIRGQQSYIAITESEETNGDYYNEADAYEDDLNSFLNY